MLSLTAWQMFFGSLPLLVAALWVPSQPIQWTGYFTMGLIYSAVISQALALVLWFYILQELPAGTASLGTMATPVIGMLAASIKLGERPTILEGLGMLLILAGLGILAVQGIILYRQLKSPVRHPS
jgi:drug/metabolite transporter (DMT)-like permease